MKAEIVCVIDRSGSMASISQDAIGGFNTFLAEQKKVPGEATLTYVQFDTDYEVVYENKPLNDVPDIDSKTYVPRGATALLDAIGKTIESVGKRLSGLAESLRPDKVIFVILTDGEENSSHEHSKAQIKDMITHQKDNYQWEFIFLAANQDAFAEGVKLGIDIKDTSNFAATGKGVRQAYGIATASAAAYRSEGSKLP